MRVPNPYYIRENTIVKSSAHPFLLSFICTGMLLQASGCNKSIHYDLVPTDTTINFVNVPAARPMVTKVAEASGIADSYANPGYLWVEEDSGNPPQLYLVNHAASSLKKVYIKGAVNTDWEDLALAPGPDAGKKYIYIGDIGDNDGVRTNISFYRMEEPGAGTDTVRSFDVIKMVYADGPRDAEAFLVDEVTKDIYIITKRESGSRLYKLSYPYSTTSANTAVFVQVFPYNLVVSAAASNDGKGIIVKTYTSLFYYPRLTGESIAQSLQKEGRVLSYQLEPQGEAVGFALDNSGFYTLSETGNGSSQSLYFYGKK